MRPRSLAILAAVVLALAAFVWFYERELPSTAEREGQQKRLFGDLESGDVREVVVARGGATLRLVREAPAGGEAEGGEEDDEGPAALTAPAGEWRLAAPIQARADRFAVDGLLSTLLAVEKGRRVESIDRARYGLAPPQAVVTLVTREGRRTLEVGNAVPGREQRMVALAGAADGWAVPGAFWSEITRPAAEWRSRELFPGQRDEVERVSLRADGDAPLVVLARRGDEFWIEAPVTDLADRDDVEELLGALTGLQAVDFLDAPPADAGLEPPHAVVEVVRRGAREPFRLLLGAARGEGEAAVRYARAAGQLVTVAPTAWEGLLARAPDEWRSPAWSSLAVYEVDRVELTDARGKLTLVRDEGDWKRGDTKIFYAPVSDLLAAVTEARAERVLSAEEARRAGLAAGPPALTITLAGADGAGRQTLTLAPGGPGGLAVARTGGREAVLLLPATVPADLAAKIEAIRKAEPLREEPAAAAPGA